MTIDEAKERLLDHRNGEIGKWIKLSDVGYWFTRAAELLVELEAIKTRVSEVGADELWDRYSEIIDDGEDIDNLSNFAGTTVLTRKGFMKMMPIALSAAFDAGREKGRREAWDEGYYAAEQDATGAKQFTTNPYLPPDKKECLEQAYESKRSEMEAQVAAFAKGIAVGWREGLKEILVKWQEHRANTKTMCCDPTCFCWELETAFDDILPDKKEGTS